ncbi:MAG: hypothetical protein Q7S47_01315 [bacterium]|nr:hypothetical protein [bacterium]
MLRTNEQLLEACEEQLILLDQALFRYPTQRFEYKNIASGLRVLVCDFGKNKPLLLDLMDQNGFKYEIKPQGKNPISLVNWQKDTLFEKSIYEPVGELLKKGKFEKAEKIISKHRKPIPLRQYVKHGLAVFIAPDDVSYHDLIKMIAEKEGLSHEDKDINTIASRLKNIKLGGEESHVASLISFAALISDVGLEFFSYLFDKKIYTPKHMEISS